MLVNCITITYSSASDFQGQLGTWIASLRASHIVVRDLKMVVIATNTVLVTALSANV